MQWKFRSARMRKLRRVKLATVVRTFARTSSRVADATGMRPMKISGQGLMTNEYRIPTNAQMVVVVSDLKVQVVNSTKGTIPRIVWLFSWPRECHWSDPGPELPVSHGDGIPVVAVIEMFLAVPINTVFPFVCYYCKGAIPRRRTSHVTRVCDVCTCWVCAIRSLLRSIWSMGLAYRSAANVAEAVEIGWVPRFFLGHAKV